MSKKQRGRNAVLGVSVILILVLLTTVFLTTAQTVSAGTNGQQLRIVVSCDQAPSLKAIEVTGLNQRGYHVVWRRDNLDTKDITTWDWWWVGQVYVKYQYAGGNPYLGGMSYEWYGDFIDVPKQFPRDVYVLILDRNMACLKYEP